MKLEEVDLGRGEGCCHPDIVIGDYYLIKLDSGEGVTYHCGTFSKQWYGLNFSPWGISGLQFDAPGTNNSRWLRVWKIID